MGAYDVPSPIGVTVTTGRPFSISQERIATFTATGPMTIGFGWSSAWLTVRS